MATVLRQLLARRDHNWLQGGDATELAAIAQQLAQVLQHWRSAHPTCDRPVIWIVEPDPSRFLAAFSAAGSIPAWVVLTNPNWATAEWQQLLAQVPPDLILASSACLPWPLELVSAIASLVGASKVYQLAIAPLPQVPQAAWPTAGSTMILIPTGGSSGHLRLAMHTWETLVASVAGFQQHFAVEQVNSCCVLPLYHVSGLMQFARSLLTGGLLAIVPWASLLAGEAVPQLSHPWADPWFLSLVPTQLQRLLNQPTPHPLLSSMANGTILLGGAPAWDSLLLQARQRQIRLAPTYGMTETASQIATLTPEEFAQGRSGCGRVLPHAQVTIRDESGAALPANQVGRVAIAAGSLMLGYAFTPLSQPEWLTDDLGWLDAAGYLHILGRRDGGILTGGETVFPAEVEAAVWQTGYVQDVCVVGVPDADWGEAIAAVYIPSASVTAAQLKTAIAPTLSRYKHPKYWLAVDQLPRNAQGKVNRPQVLELLQRHNLHTNRAKNREVDGAIAWPDECTHGG